MPVPSQDHDGFHSFPVVDWFCLFIYLWVLTFPFEGCSEFDNFVITLIYLTPPCFIQVHVLSQKNERSCIFVNDIDFPSFYVLRLFYLILELFWKCSMFVSFSLYFRYLNTSNVMSFESYLWYHNNRIMIVCSVKMKSLPPTTSIETVGWIYWKGQKRTKDGNDT